MEGSAVRTLGHSQIRPDNKYQFHLFVVVVEIG